MKLVEPDDGSGSPTTDYKYDRMERLIEIQGATVNSVRPVTTFVYTKAGDLLSTRDAMNRDTVYGLDDHGRVVTITDELNHTTTLAYDRASNVIQVTTADPDGRETQYEPLVTSHAYNARNQRVSTADPRQGVTRFSFDAATNLIALTDAEGNTTRWLFDNLDRAIAETNALSDTRYTSYDAAGNVSKIVDREGRIREFSHDPLFRLTEERWLNGTTTVRTISFAYNDADEMTSASDSDSAYAFVFDTLGRW